MGSAVTRDPPRPGWFIYKASAPGQKGPRRGRHGPRALAGGSPGESPRPVAPTQKRAQEARVARVGQSQRSAPKRAAGLSRTFRF